MADELKLAFKRVLNPAELETFSRDVSIYYDEDKIRAYREEALLKATIKDAKKNRTKIYKLYDEDLGEIIGIMALSASRLDDKPALLIDYIFVVNKYRFKKSGFYYTSFLIAFVLKKGLFFQRHVGLSNIILYPDNEEQVLIDYYKKEYGFNEIRKKVLTQNKQKNQKWLFMPLKNR